MSYITTMAVAEGVIMAADRQITQTAHFEWGGGDLPTSLLNETVVKALDNKLKSIPKFSRPMTRTARKLFTLGDIGISMGQAMFTKNGMPIGIFVDYFCRNNSFNQPKEACEKLLEYLISVGGTDTILHLAGYNKDKPDQLTPEMYRITLEDKSYSGGSNLGFNYGGYNDYFLEFSKRLNDKKQILNYSLQDAVEISKFAIDSSRFISRYFDFDDGISEDIEMIAITPNGIKWIEKAGVV